MSETQNQNNLEGVGQPSPLSAGVNAFVKMFKPDIIFYGEHLMQKYNVISIKMESGKQYELDLENDKVVYSDSRDDSGVYFQVHEAEDERVHYMTVWAKSQNGECEYGVKIFFVQDRRGRIRNEEFHIVDVRAKGE